MTTEARSDIIVQVKYKNSEETFSGSLEQVWLCLNGFFWKFLPSFEIAAKLILSVDLQKLVKECEGIVAFSKEGANLLVPRDRLTDNEALLLWLLASYLGHQLGVLQNDVSTKEELQLKLGKSGKIASTRLGELVKSMLAMKVDDDSYRITTFGVVKMQKDWISKIRAKIDG